MRPLVFVLAVLLPMSPAFAQGPHPAGPDVAEGARLYAANCPVCHGAEAKGGRGPGLVSGTWKHGDTATEIARNIHDGISGTGMPAFPLPGDQTQAIAAWLLSLNKRFDEVVTGNPQEGRRIFFQSGSCADCHSVQWVGHTFGPDLSAVGARHSAKELARIITHPGDDPAAANKGADVTTADGKHIRGAIAGEDTFSLYLRDRDENPHVLAKRDIRRRQDIKTMMPALPLDPKQVDDLVAFLKQPSGAPPEQAPWKPGSGFNITWDRLKNSAVEPQNWLHYWGDLRGTHFSGLKAITPGNVNQMSAQWTFQFGAGNTETTPIVADGLMFVTGARDSAWALDARTGFRLWRYQRALPPFHANCTVSTNRGVAILGDRLYMGTLDTHLVALDAKTGRVAFDVEVDDYKKGFSITHAPLVVGDKIIIGVTAGECALYGFIDAYDAATGRRLWRVHSIAQPGDAARQSWAGKSAETGGGPTWMTGTYDPETDTLFWATGNPSPDYDGSVRAGDNLYTCSVLALDPKTGRMKWYFQFTPHDTHDWDATETPVLIDAVFQGTPRKLMIHADRNAFFYVLDRETGKFLLGKPFVHQTWAKGLDAKGRPIVIPNTDPTPEGNYVCPDALGATNWNSPSYDSLTRLFYVAAKESCATYKSVVKEPQPGLPFTGTGDQDDESIGGKGFVTAIDPFTGDVRWRYPLQFGSQSAGVLGTAGGVLFAGSKDGYLVALDSRGGKLLWRYQTGSEIRSSPMSYAVDGRQYVAVSNDSALTVFALPAR